MLQLAGIASHPNFTLDADIAIGKETVAVVGDNGTGKSTLLSLIAGLHRLDHGRVMLDDDTLDSPESRVFVAPQHRRAAMLFQQALLFPFLNVRENVAFALRRSGIAREAADAAAIAALQRLDADRLADRKVQSLSGGEAQRVAVARALVFAPRVMLLDEPLTALDRRSRADFRALLRNELRTLGIPCLIVTHDDADIDAMCAREVRLERTTGFEPATLTLAR